MSQKRAKFKRRAKTPETADPLRGKRILAWCDSPRVRTGFGNVAGEILRRWAARGAMIDVFGVNDRGGWCDTREFPFRIYPACPGANPEGGDVYGRPLLVDVLTNRHPELRGPWDLIWVLADHFIMEQVIPQIGKSSAVLVAESAAEWSKLGYPTGTLLYTPVDSQLKQNWVVDGICPFDHVATYTDWARREILGSVPVPVAEDLEQRLHVVPHGVDLDVFKPLPEEEVRDFRSRIFGENGWLREQDFLVSVVNRNQPRKDMMRTLEIFRRFQMLVPDSRLYIHASLQDAGGNLVEMARCLKLDQDLVKAPATSRAAQNSPPELMNRIYNAADVVLANHLGEGWGLCVSEAMAAERPVVSHNITSIPFLLGAEEGSDAAEWRGLPVPSRDFCCLGLGDLERYRPTANVDVFVERLIWVYEHEAEARQMGKRGRAWLAAENLTWDRTANEMGALAAKTIEQAVERAEMWKQAEVESSAKDESVGGEVKTPAKVADESADQQPAAGPVLAGPE